ncbi:MAG: hypothetical protein LUE29_14120 [Lachnospiraceae bacterium]|nr:hypothetical protein [Lachnospiraceae bacterium]
MNRNSYKKAIGLLLMLALFAAIQSVSPAMGQEDVTTTDEISYDEDGFYMDADTGTTYYQPATDEDSDGIYEISNAGQLFWFAALVNGDASHMEETVTQNISASAVLTSDIDLGSWEWTPIGDNQTGGGNTADNVSFRGTFDGQNHSISNLTINNTNDCQGMFGYIYRGTVKNLIIDDVNITAKAYVAAVAGTIYGGSITNVYVIGGSITGSGNDAGGIAGMVRTYCTVSGCYNAAAVATSGSIAGGITGDLRNSATVTNCYNTGFVTASSNIGGIAGYVSTGQSSIINCYNVGELVSTGGNTAGGIVGSLQNQYSGDTFIPHKISGCYYLNSIADTGIATVNESSDTQVTSSMTTGQFASGEVAWLLQNGQSSQDTLVWGQMLTGESVDTCPVLTTDADIKVLKVDFYLVSDESTTLIEDATAYLNNKSLLTDYPSSGDTGYLFYTDESCTTVFEESTILTVDTDIYVRLKVISVTITWGTMEFTYSDSTQVWNPETHVYDTLEAGWTANDTDSGKVTVENEGNVDIAVSYSFAKNTDNSAVSALSGAFAIDSEGTELIDSASILSEGDSMAAWLMLSGEPEDYMEEAAVIGKVTVTINEAGTE